MKKQSNLSRLLEIAGSHKYLTYASWVFCAISALIALVPFYYIWKMIKEVLEVAPNFAQAQNLTGNGWMAVLFAVIDKYLSGDELIASGSKPVSYTHLDVYKRQSSGKWRDDPVSSDNCEMWWKTHAHQ